MELTFITAYCVHVLFKKDDLLILLKSPGQRSKKEQKRVGRGLRREVMLDFLLIVPISSVTILFFAPAFVSVVSSEMLPVVEKGLYPVLGLVGYGFPYGLIKTAVQKTLSAALTGIFRIPSNVQGKDNEDGESDDG